MSQQKTFVAVAGNIGAGKTTLTRMLSEHFGWKSHFEAVTDNPYLADFYQNMSRWSFPLQVFFLNNRFQAHQQISLGTDSSIQDRSIYEDANIFARNLFDQKIMEERDYYNYLQLYTTMCSFLNPPTLMIYLRKSVPRLQTQIEMRGRDYEKDIPESYLRSLNQYYDEWIEKYRLGKKVVIQSDHLDFVKNPKDFDLICREITDALDQKELFPSSSLTTSL